MALTDISLFSALRTRMHWHEERQRVLAENVANADTRGYRPRDLAPPQFDRNLPGSTQASLGLAVTAPGHITAAANSSHFELARTGGYNVRPSGNAVNLEDEMIKVANNQLDYQQATTLYSRSLSLLKTAVGKR